MAGHRFFFYFLVLLLPVQLGYHWWPQWSYVLGRRMDYYSPTLNLTDIFIVGTLLFWFWSYHRKQKAYSETSGNTQVSSNSNFPHLSIFIVLSLFILTNILLSQNAPVAVYSYVKLLEFTALGFYIVATKPDTYLTTVLLLVDGVIVSILALFQIALGRSLGGLFWFMGERTFSMATPGIARIPICIYIKTGCSMLLRPYATFPHPNVLGGFLAIVLLLAIFLLTTDSIYKIRFLSIVLSKKMLRVFFRIGSAVCALGVLSSFSRSAWLAVIIGLIVIAIVSGKHQVIRSFSIDYPIKLVTWIFFIGFGVSTVIFFMYPTFIMQSESVSERINLAQSAYRMWLAYPLFGVGLGNFLAALPFFTVSRSVSFLQPVHNIYILLLAEIGISGICLIMVGILFLLNRKKYSAVIRKKGHPYRLALYPLLALGFFDHYLLTLQQGLLLITLVISFALNPISGRKSGST